MWKLACAALLASSSLLPGTPPPAPPEPDSSPTSVVDVDYVADVEFAIDALEEQCELLLKSKDINWKRATKSFLKEAKTVEDHSQHLVLLTRLLARLEDGHAYVKPLPAGQDVRWPEEPEVTGPGMFWCEIDGRIHLKNVWNDAADMGLEAGWEVVKVDGTKAVKWLDERVEELRDRHSFSTEQHARFWAMHRGLALPVGTRLDIELKTLERKKKKRTLTYRKANPTPWGPAFFPEGLAGEADVRWAELEGGFGYIHVRRCKSTVIEQMDAALAAVGDAPGLVIDFRGNSGGGFDHEGLLGRFVPKGYTLSFAKPHDAAGPKQYGGPIVVIVDATCVSAGETGSGMFKEEGRAYMIGESATAGMSSQKTTIPLPSGLFELYVSTHSNKGRFNEGRGIEGVGVQPHEIVQFDPEDLAAGRDTLIEHARRLLEDFPQKDVPYRPKEAGWTP